MDDLLSEFLTETNESLENLDLELVRLEQNPNDPELIGNIFRLVHTIKGTCGFLGLPRLEALAHAGENVLGNFRDQTQEVTPPAVTLILESLDRVKLLLSSLEETESEPEGNDSDLIDRLDVMYQAGKKGAAAPAAAEAAAAPAGTDTGATVFERIGGMSVVDTAVELLYRKIMKDEDLTRFFEGADMVLLQGRQVEFMTKALGGPDEYGGRDLRTVHKHLVEDGLDSSHFDKVAVMLSESLTELEVPAPLIDEVIAIVATTRGDVLDMDEQEQEAADAAAPEPEPEAIAAAAEPPAAAAGGPPEAVQPKESSVASQSIRVNVDLLENLMTMVSELVLTRNQLMQMVRQFDDSEFKVPLQRLSHVTTDLQEGVMKTRMQPIGNAWGKLPRIIRDLGHELDKKIELKMLGADTELDRQILEMIKDPLTHMVRNSADHGIETPADRVAAGKPEGGTVVLNAYHEGGHILIEISDDGHGINVDKVKQKVIEKELATEAEMEAMTEQQILQFIFKAGFSTAEKVTAVSGRGVGMDVVRTNIEKIGGQVELRSAVGKGSTFTIKIPLTLAIVSALIVECRKERFAIPQLSVVELVRITQGSEHRIEKIKDTPVLRLRDRLLPLVSLGELLKLGSNKEQAFVADGQDVPAGAESDQETGATGEGDGGGVSVKTHEETFIVVSQVGNYTFGIIVDRVFDTEEIVVKPVAPILRDIAIYSGNTILGDGSVIMILDPNGIAASTGEIMMADQAAAHLAESAQESGKEKTAFLVFRTKAPEPKAVPLALVARLEELDRSTIEYSHGTPVVQYRGSLMPLLSIEDSYEISDEGRQPVLVFTDRERSMGLMAEEIIDIVEDHLNIELASNKPGMIGSAVIGGKATDVIDASAFLTEAFGDWYGSEEVINADLTKERRSILLVDDSPFFRNLLTPLLNVAGYDVTSADSVDNALALREAGKAFDIIVSDIEMPGMTGFDFAEQVRDGGSWQETPMVALSSHTLPADLQKGRQVGFDDYVTKLDREALLRSLSETLSGVRGAA